MTSVFVNTEDPELYSLLEYIIAAEGFTARLIAHRDDLREHSSADRAVVILDAHNSTLEICRSIIDGFALPSTTVIGLVRQGAIPSHLELLRAGATECLTRPFHLSALLELIRKGAGNEERAMARSRAPHVLLDPSERSVTWQGQTARLSPIEFALFADLYAHRGQVRIRSDLLAAARTSKCNVAGRVVDVHVCRLRRSLAPFGSRWIETIRSSGYRLRVPPTD